MLNAEEEHVGICKTEKKRKQKKTDLGQAFNAEFEGNSLFEFIKI